MVSASDSERGSGNQSTDDEEYKQDSEIAEGEKDDRGDALYIGERVECGDLGETLRKAWARNGDLTANERT